MNRTLRRRELLKAGMAGLTLAVAGGRRGNASPAIKDTVRFAFIGVGGRGTGLLRALLNRPEVQVAAICDIDEDHLNRALRLVEEARGNTPAG